MSHFMVYLKYLPVGGERKQNTMKKRLSLIISMIMLITSVFATNTFAAFTDVSDNNPYKEAITTLSKLTVINGYEDNTFKPEGAITRAEFAKITACTLGYADATSNATIFTDVGEHWAKHYINVCADLGIINGMGDGTFAPDSPVTYEQALKMIVCMLGYMQDAEAYGGYPDGYTKAAGELGLTKGVKNVAYNQGAPRGVIAQAMFNALEVNITEKDALGNISKTDKTLLNTYLKVRRLEGTLVGVEEYTTSDCSMTLGKGDMVVEDASGKEYLIDYTTYTNNVVDIKNYLGKAIAVYYRQIRESDERTLVIIDDETTENDVITINSSDIYSCNQTQIRHYDKSGSLLTTKLDLSEASIRYNGKLVEKTDNVTLTSSTVTAVEAVIEWLNPSSADFIYGQVTITDSGADGTIDLLEIEDYETMVAYKKPTSSDYRIQDKLKTANYLILDPSSTRYSFTITKDGKQIETTDIAANDVILYAESLDGTVYTAYVTSNKVSGEIKSTSDGVSKITIDSKTYNVRQTCIDYVTNVLGKEFKVGVNGQFHMDKFGNIVFATITAAEEIPYAYIISADIENATNEGYVSAYAPTSSSTVKTYIINNKVKIDGTSYTSAEAVYEIKQKVGNSNKDVAKASEIYGSGTPTITDASQLVRLKISGGKVSEIITLADDTLDAGGSLVENVQNEDTSKLVRYRSLGKAYYTSNGFKETSSSSNTLFTINSSTNVIYLPMNRTTKTGYAKKTGTGAFATGDSYYVEAYNVNSSKVAGLVVVYGEDASLTKVTKNTEFSVVGEEIGSAYNEVTGKNSLNLNIYKGASDALEPWITYDDTEFANCVPGDVIQFAYDTDKLAQDKVVNIKFSDIAAVLDNQSGTTVYDWSTAQTPDASNNYQSYLFDYRFKKANGDDETYYGSAVGTVPHTRAFMGNVLQVLEDEKKIYVTKNGFNKVGEEWTIDDTNYEELSITSTTKIIRMESNRKSFSKFVEDTETPLAFTDLKDARNYSIDCNKVLISTFKGQVRLIVIYQ